MRIEGVKQVRQDNEVIMHWYDHAAILVALISVVVADRKMVRLEKRIWDLEQFGPERLMPKESK